MGMEREYIGKDARSRLGAEHGHRRFLELEQARGCQGNHDHDDRQVRLHQQSQHQTQYECDHVVVVNALQKRPNPFGGGVSGSAGFHEIESVHDHGQAEKGAVAINESLGDVEG